MKYDIYFHNDFDGRASAAVMLAFLRSRGDGIAHYVPVDFYLLPQWLDGRFFEKHRLFKGKRNPAIVVDFPYHPAAAFWFDHHEAPFRKPGWQKRFVPDAEHIVGPDYSSCCHLVYDSLKKNFGWRPLRHFTELVRWLDVIDGAHYASARQTFAVSEPALCIDAFIDKTAHSTARAAWMVKLLAGRPLARIANIPEVKKIAAAERLQNARVLPFYKEHVVMRGNVAYIDLTQARVKILRHAIYYFAPRALYGLRFVKKGKLYHVGVGANPWSKKKNTVHLGKLMKRYGGGGHAGVGAADFASHAQALRAVNGIVDVLNRKKR